MQKLYGDSGNEHNHQCLFDGLFIGDDLVVDFDHLLGHVIDTQARTGDEDGAGQVQQILTSNWQNDAYRPAVGNSGRFFCALPWHSRSRSSACLFERFGQTVLKNQCYSLSERVAGLSRDVAWKQMMRYFGAVIACIVLVGGCSMSVTSPIAEKVRLYSDPDTIPEACEQLGEVITSVCANTTPCPDEVMKRDIREQAHLQFGADAVWLANTTLSGTRVIGYGVAYSCQ